MIIKWTITSHLTELTKPSRFYTLGDTCTRGGQPLHQQNTNKDLYSNSFVPRSTREWNALPDSMTIHQQPHWMTSRPVLLNCPCPQQQLHTTVYSFNLLYICLAFFLHIYGEPSNWWRQSQLHSEEFDYNGRRIQKRPWHWKSKYFSF